MTTQDDIRCWIQRGIKQGSKFMVVLCDTWDYDDYPCFFNTKEEALARIANPGLMQRYMESYDLTKPIEPQINAVRAHI